ncbi:hypothetical protein ACS0PU_002634 [Formica fusca]
MSKRKRVEDVRECVREHLKKNKLGNSGKVGSAETGLHLPQAQLKVGASKILPADKSKVLSNYVVQNYSSRSTFNNGRGLLSDKTNTPDLHTNQQILRTAFSVQELPSGFLVKNSQKENYSTLSLGGQRLNLQQFPIIDDQQQVLNNIVSINETEPIEELPTAENVFSQSDDEYSTQDIEEDDRSGEREDENVDDENEQDDNNNNESDTFADNENEEFRAPYNPQNTTQNLLNVEQLTHDINKCCRQ